MIGLDLFLVVGVEFGFNSDSSGERRQGEEDCI